MGDTQILLLQVISLPTRNMMADVSVWSISETTVSASQLHYIMKAAVMGTVDICVEEIS